ncbi:hypothetical protein EVAR_18275_1 [Eumeta japonica]|uniref:Uncharacterized protein n=1 Tax=Eumeta variegata TaxID=151549 RepID=A0A4C1UJN0_EUMVA|nr:hypothetical protein EVAR_18275_1 [Eumeta japonica]
MVTLISLTIWARDVCPTVTAEEKISAVWSMTETDKKISTSRFGQTYASAERVWQKKNERRINAVEMRSLCIMCGVSLKEKCKNIDVREWFERKCDD